MAVNQGLPAPAYPFVDNSGKINPIWYQFLSSLWQRSGGGTNIGNVQSITVNSTDGILSSVTNPTDMPVINLSVGGITPTSVTTPGAVIGNSGYFQTGLSTGGVMQFGAYVNSTISNTGYILINDATGTPRRLMVG